MERSLIVYKNHKPFLGYQDSTIERIHKTPYKFGYSIEELVVLRESRIINIKLRGSF